MEHPISFLIIVALFLVVSISQTERIISRLANKKPANALTASDEAKSSSGLKNGGKSGSAAGSDGTEQTNLAKVKGSAGEARAAAHVFRSAPTETQPAAAQPTYKQDCVGSACAQGQGSQATFNQFGPPPAKITTSNVRKIAAGADGHPRAAIDFYTDRPDDYGQFEVSCDRACIPVDVCILIGQNTTKFATVPDEPDIGVFLFQRQFPATTWCTLTVESRDEKPIEITAVRILKHENLTLNAVQPVPKVAAAGMTIQ